MLGACGVLVAHPLDTIKTWQQASNTSVLTAVQQIYSRNNGVSADRHSSDQLTTIFKDQRLLQGHVISPDVNGSHQFHTLWHLWQPSAATASGVPQ